VELNDKGLVRVLRALSDPTRFRIVQEIAAAGELCCKEVVARFAFSQPTISHHLKILVHAGLVQSRRDGSHRYVTVNEAVLGRLPGLLEMRLLAGRKRKLQHA
jgi:ArsR family transcriptional regulator